MELYFPLILDGANGTELQKRGYDGSVCAESWVLDHPEVMTEIQRGYLEAGSNVVYAPTFGANRIKLEENGIAGKVSEYNKALVKISREAVGDKALVAGDIATTGKFLAPLGDVTFDELYDIYHEQAEALEEAGVDMFVIETIMTVPDARAALLAVRDVSDKPVLVSFTCDENGRTLTGTDVQAACVILQRMGVDAFGLNCSVGPDDLIKQIRRVHEVAEVPLAAKPNAGLPKTIDGKTVYNCPPDEFAQYTKAFAAAGAGLFGGCCGTGASHIKAIRDELEDFEFVRPDPVKTDGILCATEKDVFVVEPGITADKVLKCGPDLAEKISAENKSQSKVIAIEISSREDLESFGTAQYSIRKPLCLLCEDAEYLGRALALYQGIAVYIGSLPDDELAPLVKRYGLII